MATYTQNYTLHQWEDSDDFLRTDFNTDFAKIDTAIKGVSDDMVTALTSKCEVVIGSYTGNGSSSRTITLGFQPSAVLLETHNSYRLMSSSIYGGLFLPNAPLYMGDTTAAEITTTGFKVYYGSYAQTNTSTYNYRYIAFK